MAVVRNDKTLTLRTRREVALGFPESKLLRSGARKVLSVGFHAKPERNRANL